MDENIETLKYCEIHLLAAVWYMYACILQILNQHAKKNLPAVMGGGKSRETVPNLEDKKTWGKTMKDSPEVALIWSWPGCLQ